MQGQMYDVEKGSEPPQEGAEQRLGKAAQRIQEIDKEIAHLQEEREVAAQEVNRATEVLQSSIEKAQHVLSANARPETRDSNW